MATLKLRKCNIKLIDLTDNIEIKSIIQAYHKRQKCNANIYIYKDCEICQQSQYERHLVNLKLHITPTITKVFATILNTFTFATEEIPIKGSF